MPSLSKFKRLLGVPNEPMVPTATNELDEYALGSLRRHIGRPLDGPLARKQSPRLRRLAGVDVALPPCAPARSDAVAISQTGGPSRDDVRDRPPFFLEAEHV